MEHAPFRNELGGILADEMGLVNAPSSRVPLKLKKEKIQPYLRL